MDSCFGNQISCSVDAKGKFKYSFTKREKKKNAEIIDGYVKNDD